MPDMPYRKSSFTDFSWKDGFLGLGGLVIVLMLMLLSIGMGVIFSASYSFRTGKVQPYAMKQLVWFGVAMIPFVAILFIDYKWLLKNAYVFYFISICLLILTAFCGVARGGSRRWLKIGPVLLQTSEIMKLAIILILARILTRQRKTGSLLDLLLPYGITLLPMLLIMMQPDLGTSLVFMPIVFAMVFASGVPVKHLILLILVGLNVVIPLYHFGLHDYQKNRVKMFVFQSQMSQEQKKGAGYHLVQSKIAHGNGGFLGRGWRQGTQNYYGLLPERHTDFIFAIVGEEWGFVGTTAVLLIYVALFFTMLLIAYTTPVPSMQLIVIGVTMLLLTHTIVNTAMTVGLAPITGLPLPFVSYGGSALLFNCSAVALVISIAGRRAVRSA